MAGLNPAEDAPHGLLGGRVMLRQPAAGLRAGLDAVMLAAACPVTDGERVLDLGCGPGGVMLCILARVPGATAWGVEREPVLADLARRNLAVNGWAERGGVTAADAADFAPGERFHHAVSNPPWWPGGTAPPEALRRAATHDPGEGLAVWVGAMARALRPRGTATVILPAALLDLGIEALRSGGFGAVTLRPLWPRRGMPASRVLLSGRLGAKGGATLHEGLALHDGPGWTAAAAAVLRDGASFDDAARLQVPASG